jgi:hypothetical protein
VLKWGKKESFLKRKMMLILVLVLILNLGVVFGKVPISALNSFHPISQRQNHEHSGRNQTMEIYRALSLGDQYVLPDNTNEEDRKVFQKILNYYQQRLKQAEQTKRNQQQDGSSFILPSDDDEYLEDEEDDVATETLANKGKKPLIVLNPCSPKHCKAKFTALKVPYEVPCSSASGSIPTKIQLPLSYPGNYDLCRTFEFAQAHFCTIQTPFVVAPLLDPKDKSSYISTPVDYLNLGGFFIGKCVPDQCTAELLKKRFISGLQSTARKMVLQSLNRHLRVDILMMESYLASTVEVNCVREDSHRQGEEFESMGTALFFFLFAILFVFALIFTLMHHIYPNTHNKYTLAFSFSHNAMSLIQPMKGEYVFLNGVRVISMLWVVYGHVVLQSTIGLQIPLANPSAVDYQLQDFSMTYVRGAEYSVDTFFFMSGLLATHGILEAMNSHRMPKLGFTSYFLLIFVRFIRLTPIYMFVLFFFVKAMPYCGDGPYWHLNNNRKDLENACKNWYTNLFYFNNLYPFGPDGGVRSCMVSFHLHKHSLKTYRN